MTNKRSLPGATAPIGWAASRRACVPLKCHVRCAQGLKTSGGGAGAHAVNGADGGGNRAEQAVGAALRYRAYAPVLDKLLQEVGLAEHGFTGTLGSVARGVAVQTGRGGCAVSPRSP